MNPDLIAQAHDAIARGADPQAVAAAFREMTGQDLPSPAVAAGQIAPPGAEQPVPAGDPTYMPPFARDAIQVTPEQAKATVPAMIGAASALPVGGFLAREAIGGVSGAALGAAGAEPGERMKGAIKGGLLGMGGALVSQGLASGTNAIVRRGAGRGARVAQGLLKETELPADFEKLAEEVGTAKRAVSEKLYGPIDKLGKINNAKISVVLEESGVPSAGKPRSLAELQKLLSNLERSNPPAATELKAVMEQEIDGLKAANAAYGPAVRPAEALEAGRASYRTAADIRQAMKGMGPEEARNFAAARLHDITAALEKRDENAVAMLRQFVDAGPETKAQLRTLFRGDDAAFGRFLDLLGKERSAMKVGELVKLLSPFGAVGAAGVGIGYGAKSLFK